MCINIEFHLHSLWWSSDRASVWSPSTALLLVAMAWYSFFLAADPAGGGGPEAGGGGGGGGGGGIKETSADIFGELPPLHKINVQFVQYFSSCLRTYIQVALTKALHKGWLRKSEPTYWLLPFFSSESNEHEWTLGCLSSSVRCYCVISDMHIFSFCGVLFH